MEIKALWLAKAAFLFIMIEGKRRRSENVYTILIVEDDAVIAGEIKRHMEKWDYQAVCVQDFKAVLAEFAEVTPQLVLMDISLPYFSGYHWCAEIRKL